MRRARRAVSCAIGSGRTTIPPVLPYPICVTVSLTIGRLATSRQHRNRITRNARDVVDGRVVNGRIVRQRSHACSEFHHWQAEKIDEFDLGGECGELLGEMAPERLTLEWIPYQSNSPEIRHERPRRGNRVAHRQSKGGSGDIGRKARETSRV